MMTSTRDLDGSDEAENPISAGTAATFHPSVGNDTDPRLDPAPHGNHAPRPQPRSMGDIIDVVRTDPTVRRSGRDQFISRVRALSRWLGYADPASLLLADLHGMGDKIAALDPYMIGVSAARLSRVKAAVRLALGRYAGIGRPTGVPIESPAWAKLMDEFAAAGAASEVSPRQLHRYWCELRPVVAYLSRRRIEPDQVTPADVESYFDLLRSDPFLRDKRLGATWKEIQRAWNLASRIIPGWAQFKIRSPFWENCLRLDLSVFPVEFREDVERYCASRGIKSVEPDLMNSPSRLVRLRASRSEHIVGASPKTRKPLGPETLKDHVYCILRAASALARRGRCAAHQIRSIADVATIDAALDLVTEGPSAHGAGTLTGGCYVSVLCSVAIRWRSDLSRAEFENWRALRHDVANRQPMEISPRTRERLGMVTPATEVMLAKLPATIMKRVDVVYRANGRKPVPRKLAAEARAAMAVWLLMRVAPTRKALLNTHLDLNFERRREGVILHYPAGNRARQPTAAELDRSEARRLTLYQKACMPALVAPGNCYLFGSAVHAGTISAETLGNQVSRLVRDAIGIKVNVDLFRAILARILLRENPRENRYLAASLLGLRPNSSAPRKFIDLSSAWAHDAVNKAIT